MSFTGARYFGPLTEWHQKLQFGVGPRTGEPSVVSAGCCAHCTAMWPSAPAAPVGPEAVMAGRDAVWSLWQPLQVNRSAGPQDSGAKPCCPLRATPPPEEWAWPAAGPWRDWMPTRGSPTYHETWAGHQDQVPCDPLIHEVGHTQQCSISHQMDLMYRRLGTHGPRRHKLVTWSISPSDHGPHSSTPPSLPCVLSQINRTHSRRPRGWVLSVLGAGMPDQGVSRFGSWLQTASSCRVVAWSRAGSQVKLPCLLCVDPDPILRAAPSRSVIAQRPRLLGHHSGLQDFNMCVGVGHAHSIHNTQPHRWPNKDLLPPADQEEDIGAWCTEGSAWSADVGRTRTTSAPHPLPLAPLKEKGTNFKQLT